MVLTFFEDNAEQVFDLLTDVFAFVIIDLLRRQIWKLSPDVVSFALHVPTAYETILLVWNDRVEIIKTMTLPVPSLWSDSKLVIYRFQTFLIPRTIIDRLQLSPETNISGPPLNQPR